MFKREVKIKTNNRIIAEYPYLYETHLHTKNSSACGKNTGYEMAKACHEAGYTGMIVTDHNWGGNTAISPNISWEEWLDEFEKSYIDAKKYGDKYQFDVFFGYEAGYDGTEFLIYGVDIEWMKAHPELKSATIEEQYKMIHHAGGIVIHAHPFRQMSYIPEIRLFPEYVDGVEGLNASHINSLFNERAIEKIILLLMGIAFIMAEEREKNENIFYKTWSNRLECTRKNSR